MLVFLAVFAAIFGYFLAIGIRQTEERLVERSSAAAQVVSSNAFWIAEVAHQTLRRVDAALGPAMSGSMADLGPVLEGLPSVTDVYIIDAQAKTIYATVEGASAVSVADRDYFIAVRDGAPFYTSPLLVSRLTGDRIFVFSKRVERGGNFAGAIMVSFPESVLADLWRNLDFEDTSTISLVRDDGQLIARFPQTEGPVDLSQTPLFTEHLKAGDTGTYTSARSPVDGVARVVSYRRVPGTNIIALASVGSAQSWANFNGAVVAVFIIVSPIVLGLVLGLDRATALSRCSAGQGAAGLARGQHHAVPRNPPPGEEQSAIGAVAGAHAGPAAGGQARSAEPVRRHGGDARAHLQARPLRGYRRA
jgi:hypothetical protein